MFSKISKRFTYANVALTLALVLTMSGGAYAASKYIITSTKQISPKVIKALEGKTGSKGQAGTPGPAGLAGSKGETGAAGAKGDVGPVGEKGEAGPTGPQGPQGPQGHPGEKGESGFTETLPSGKTETGEWSLVRSVSGAEERDGTGVSFNIPLGTAPVAHFIRTTGKEPFYNATVGIEKEEERTQPECPGSASDPKADAGSLCVYASGEEGALKNILGNNILPAVCSLGSQAACIGIGSGADKMGFGVETLSEGAGLINVAGSWAVTAR
ncbi:MAG TPA: hypothetical protein VIJ39_12370 [Solirubrobacteraceae bacterium]